MDNNCVFCKIVNKDINSDIVYENDKVLAFSDIDPKAPVHILIVPKKHISTVLEIKDEDKDILLALWQAVNEISKQKGIDKDGFRVVTNCGQNGGQTVFHIHFHLLGGRQMQWPPG